MESGEVVNSTDGRGNSSSGVVSNSSSNDHHNKNDKNATNSAGKRGSIRSLEEEFKKTEAGLLPVIIKLWSFIRLRFPWLLFYIGERPPRPNLCGQVLIIYFLFIHVILSYEVGKRCKTTAG